MLAKRDRFAGLTLEVWRKRLQHALHVPGGWSERKVCLILADVARQLGLHSLDQLLQAGEFFEPLARRTKPVSEPDDRWPRNSFLDLKDSLKEIGREREHAIPSPVRW